MNYTIVPGVGMDELAFGIDRDTVIRIIGKPDGTDEVSDDGFDSEMWVYSKLRLTLFFEGENVPVLVCIETSHPDALLFGERIFGMTERAIIELLQRNKFTELETEKENWGEYRVSFDDAMIDFYFENGKLSTVNWSLISDDDEE